MLEQYYQLSFASERIRKSPLAPFVDEIIGYLKSQNCTGIYVQGVMRGVFSFGHWLHDNGISLKHLTMAHVQT
jgi:hypothetical protein